MTQVNPGSNRVPFDEVLRCKLPAFESSIDLANTIGYLIPSVPTNWTVITGASSSGKSTTIRLLRRLQFPTMAEAARLVINRAVKAGYSKDEIYSEKNGVVRQSAILAKGLQRELRLPPGQPYILDRSFMDAIPFSAEIGIRLPQFERLATLFNYKRILYFEPLPLRGDAARPENQSFDTLRRKVDERSRRFWTDLGYGLTVIPAYDPKGRLLTRSERLVLTLQALGVSGERWAG